MDNKQKDYYESKITLLENENKELKNNISILNLRLLTENNSIDLEKEKNLLAQTLLAKNEYYECIKAIKEKEKEIDSLIEELKQAKLKNLEKFNKAIDKTIKLIK